MSGGREVLADGGTDLGDHDLSHDVVDPGDGGDQVAESLKRRHHHLDALIECGDRALELVDDAQVQTDHERVVVVEASEQSLVEQIVAPQRALGQFGQHLRVALPDRQGIQHQPDRDQRQSVRSPHLSLIPASSSSFSIRDHSRVRSWVNAVRALVRSRNSRIGGGGTNEERTSPCAPRSASHIASETSLLRPGIARTWDGLAKIVWNGASSNR